MTSVNLAPDGAKPHASLLSILVALMLWPCVVTVTTFHALLPESGTLYLAASAPVPASCGHPKPRLIPSSFARLSPISLKNLLYLGAAARYVLFFLKMRFAPMNKFGSGLLCELVLAASALLRRTSRRFFAMVLSSKTACMMAALVYR